MIITGIWLDDKVETKKRGIVFIPQQIIDFLVFILYHEYEYRFQKIYKAVAVELW